MVDQLVGRSAELEAVLRACRTGQGALLVITGEAGIGKTRLCNEAQSRAREDDVTVVMARCWNDGGAPPLWPWQSLLDALCGPDVFQALTNDVISDDPAHPGSARDRFSRYAAAADAIADSCAGKPTCLIIDDIHAAEESTLLFTRFLARSLHRIGLAMVLTRRDTEPDDTARAQLIDDIENEAVLLPLRRFTRSETRELLTLHRWGGSTIDDSLVGVVSRLTGGHPLFLHRLMARRPSPRAVTGLDNAAGPAAEVGVPQGLVDSIDQAVRNLAPEHEQILRTCALAGLDTSVAVAAATADTSPQAVWEAVRAATAAGLLTAATPGRVTFSHEVTRATLADGLSSAERLDAHARAAAVFNRQGPEEHQTQRAHHALAAAPRSAPDAQLAVEACREAARTLTGQLAYEHADSLLSAATRLYETAALGPPPADLLVEWAQAALLRGQLSEARQRFTRAAAAARSADDPVLLAEASVGLGGYWLTEARDAIVRAQVAATQEEALRRLPATETGWRARLDVRLKAEAHYNGGPAEPMFEALETARAVGDPVAHADALSLCHHALLRPEHTRSRLALADELVQVGAVAGHGVLALMGLSWRTLDLYCLGDPRAPRALEELRRRADALACQVVLYIVGLLDVLTLIRAGKFADAETHAETVCQLGDEVGDPDAYAYMGAQIGAIRWFQGRTAEVAPLMESIATSPDVLDTDFAYKAASAVFAYDGGRRDIPRQVLNELCEQGLAELHRSSTWMVGMLGVVELAASMNDAQAARDLYGLLLPYADLPTIASIGVACLGSTHRCLALAARTYGDLPLAAEHLRQAIPANQRLRHLPMTAMCQGDLGELLLTMEGQPAHAPSHRDEARHLLDEAARQAEAIGMDQRAQRWRERAEEHAGPSRAPSGQRASRQAPTARSLEGQVRREGNGWHISLGDRHVYLGDLVGMRYLAELLSRPAQPVPALILASLGRATDPGSGQAVIDTRARTAYETRARDLAAELAEAEGNADIGRAERLRIELDALTDQIEQAGGLSGHVREFAGPEERARTAVHKAIKRAINAIDAADPVIGARLRISVTTGRSCIYDPYAAATTGAGPVSWTVSR